MNLRLSVSILLLTLLTTLSGWGQQVKLVSVSPSEGETVSTLDATLTFDIEEAAESQGLIDNCCIYGRLTFTYYSGYGTANQVKLGSKLVKYSGTTEGAKYSKLQEFYAPAPSDINVVEGENYTITVSGTASISKYGYDSNISAARITLSSKDVVINCVGGKPDPSSFYFVGTSLANTEAYKEIPDITVTFSQPVSIVGASMPYINKNSTLIATAKDVMVKADDPCSIVISFENANLPKGSYTAYIPKGLICQADKPERSNNELDFALKGAYVEYYTYKTTKPEINGVGLEENYFIEFDLQDDQKLSTSSVSTEVYLYENEVNEANLCGTFTVSLRGSSFFPHEIEVPVNYTYKPDTRYIFVLPEGVFTVQSMYVNSRIEIPFTTPSVETSGYAPMKFKAANGRYGSVMPEEFVDNKEYDKLGVVDLVFANYRYQDWDLRYNPAEDSDISDAILYDITSGERKETGRASLSRVKRETKVDLFYALTMTFDNPLYANHEYELVIPTKEVGVSNIVYSNFIPKDDEFILKLKGSTPVGEPYPVVCSLNDNQEVEALHTVHWTFPSGFAVADPSLKAKIELPDSEDREGWLSMESDKDGSYLTAIFTDRHNGQPVSLGEGQKASVVLPAGTVVFAGLPDEVTNEEIRIGVTGKSKEFAEKVSVELVVAGQLSSVCYALKGENFTLKLTPDENWRVDILTCNDDDITDKVENGVYTAESLDADTRFDVAIAFTGTFVVADESELVNGVEINDAGLKVSKQDGSVVLEGTKDGDEISVYTVNGQLIGKHRAAGNIVRLTLTPGATYIVRINDNAIKIII